MTELPEEDYPEIWPRPELLKPADLAAAAELNAGDAGDPLAFRRRFFDEDPEAAAVVPCRGCRECCYHPNVDVDPKREPPENLARLDLERREDGNWYLSKREDGACVHLGPEGCTVYQHRPQACRSYDCRWFTLFGAQDDSFDDGRTPPWWEFHPTTAEGHAFLTVCLMLGAVQRTHWEDCGEGCDGIETAVLTNPSFNIVMNAVMGLTKSERDQLAETLFIAPPSAKIEVEA